MYCDYQSVHNLYKCQSIKSYELKIVLLNFGKRFNNPLVNKKSIRFESVRTPNIVCHSLIHGHRLSITILQAV